MSTDRTKTRRKRLLQKCWGDQRAGGKTRRKLRLKKLRVGKKQHIMEGLERPKRGLQSLPGSKRAEKASRAVAGKPRVVT